MTQALIIVDIQNDYFPGGKMELVGSNEAAGEAARLLSAFRRRGAPIFHIQHISTRPGATFFLPDTQGVKIHASVAPLAAETIITKHFPNSFRETRLLEALREAKIERLAIAGMMTHMCIDATTRAAADLGFECQLAHDACATRDLSFGGSKVAARDVHTAFLASLNGAFAKVLPASEIAGAVIPA
jgi:nicotinamidase-related amidase